MKDSKSPQCKILQTQTFHRTVLLLLNKGNLNCCITFQKNVFCPIFCGSTLRRFWTYMGYPFIVVFLTDSRRFIRIGKFYSNRHVLSKSACQHTVSRTSRIKFTSFSRLFNSSRIGFVTVRFWTRVVKFTLPSLHGRSR